MTNSSLSSRDQLILNYMPLVRRIALSVFRSIPQGVTCFDDLVSAGTAGLIEAADSYDSIKARVGDGGAGRGVDLAMFAKQRIFGSIMNELRGMDAVTQVQRKRAKQIVQTQSLLRKENGRDATQEEVAIALGISVREYHTMVSTSALAFSIESIDNVGGRGLSVPSPGPSAETHMIDQQEKTFLATALANAMLTLDERERTAVTEHFLREKSKKEIGQKLLSIDESRVRQLLKRALGKLKVSIDQQRNQAIAA